MPYPLFIPTVCFQIETFTQQIGTHDVPMNITDNTPGGMIALVFSVLHTFASTMHAERRLIRYVNVRQTCPMLLSRFPRPLLAPMLHIVVAVQ